jgi:hypothetical protein
MDELRAKAQRRKVLQKAKRNPLRASAKLRDLCAKCYERTSPSPVGEDTKRYQLADYAQLVRG